MTDVDVAVIGAGPAGSVTAGAIAERGFSVALIERDSFPGESNVCGGTTSMAVADSFEVPALVIERTISKFNCYFPGESFSFDVPFASFQRRVFDRFLAERAVSKGAQLLTRTVVTDVEAGDGGVLVKAAGRLGAEPRQLSAQLVVFADGPDTMAARVFPGVGFRRRPSRTMQGLLYEFEWPANPLDSLDFFFGSELVPWGYGWVFPKRDLVNVGVCGIIAAGSSGRGMRGSLDYFVREHPVSSNLTRGRKVSRIQAAIIPVEQAPRIYARRSLLVGDAAGMVEPFSAGGNEYAMRAGLLAAKTAADALREGDFGEGSLSRYQDAWRRSGDGKTLRMMQRLLWLGWVYRRIDSKASVKFYSYVFHKVAEETRKHSPTPAA